jgi:hypothetical protein
MAVVRLRLGCDSILFRQCKQRRTLILTIYNRLHTLSIFVILSRDFFDQQAFFAKAETAKGVAAGPPSTPPKSRERMATRRRRKQSQRRRPRSKFTKQGLACLATGDLGKAGKEPGPVRSHRAG